MKISKFKKALTDFNVKYQQSISLDLSGARRYRIYNAISGEDSIVIFCAENKCIQNISLLYRHPQAYNTEN